MGTIGSLFLFLHILYGKGLAQAVVELAAVKEKETHEPRIILRYESGSAISLNERVKHLEHLSGVRRAEVLPSLDMAVVACDADSQEDDMLEILQAQDGVEVAVPDTWLQLDEEHVEKRPERLGSANPQCSAIGLRGLCCPTPDGLHLGCCDDNRGAAPLPRHREHGLSTISLQSWHGGFMAGMPWGAVGFYPNKLHPDTHFFVVAHDDGYNSLKTQYGTYVVATPSGRLALWHRGHPEADDFEKFKFIYNKDGTLTLRSKISDMYVAAEDPLWGVLSADRDEIDDWEKFNVTFTHGKDTVIPNDASLDRLWGLHHYGDRDIDAAEAWRIAHAPSPEGIVVAVIDTGIDYTHPDLKDQMWVNPNEIPDNGIDDDGNGIVDDIHGADFANNDGDPMDDQMHGTHCAGTIAGNGNNSIGVAGVAWQGVRLMAMKFLSASGGGRTSDAIKCLNYAVAMGAKLSSNSWGGGGSSSAMRVAIERAEQAGMLFIAAAGNEGSDNDEFPHYPSNYPTANIVSVASTTKTGSLSSFSCYGKTTVDVAAPGSSIYSTVPNNKYASLSGTSMATPHVSGLAALIWLHRPQLTMPQVKRILMESTTKVDALQNSSLTEGRINARRALILAASYDALYPPVNRPQSLVFMDTDPEVGRIGGVAYITAAADESDVAYYSLHFMSVAGFLMERVGRVNASGAVSLQITLQNVTIPKYVTSLAVVAANKSATAGPSKAAVVDIKDYGVPKYGPGEVSWGGDVDGRLGYIAGQIQFRRAKAESSITHYNLYWKDEARSFLGKVPASGFATPSCEGDCSLVDTNITGDVYTFHRGAYTNNEMAAITFSGPATVWLTSFRTEKYYDYLEIGGQQLSGTRLVLPMRFDLESGPQRITWSSDRSEVEEGWTLDLLQTGSMASYALQPLAPPSWHVEVVSAYADTEGQNASQGELSDFDASKMPPSAALKPRQLSFVDVDVQQGIIEGHIQFLPPPSCEETITFYKVFVADAQGEAIDGFQWTLPGTQNCSALMQVTVERREVPSDAVQVVVITGNQNGEGPSQSVPLVDIVRSAPVNATFTGDSDPARNQVKGGIRITPAANPKGIRSYAIYFVNGTSKEKLLGRVAAELDEVVVYEFHIIVKTSLRDLLVVSVYEDMEMDEGIFLHFEDVYDDPDEAEDDGRRLAAETSDLEPWLRRPHPPAWNEVQLLWTEPSIGELQTKKSAIEVRSDKRVMGSLTIPGILGSVSTSGTRPTFVPPSLEARKALVSVLAESLPAVSQEQVRLTKGQMLTCQAAVRSKQLKFPAPPDSLDGACLVINFEVLPDASLALHAKHSQDFLDMVEARLIALHRGSSAAQKMTDLLRRRLQGVISAADGVWAVVGEPQQIAPKVHADSRSLTSIGLGEEWEDEPELPEEAEEASPLMLSVSIGALLGGITAASCAALRLVKYRKSLVKEPMAMAVTPQVDPVQPVSDPSDSLDVSLQLGERNE